MRNGPGPDPAIAAVLVPHAELGAVIRPGLFDVTAGLFFNFLSVFRVKMIDVLFVPIFDFMIVVTELTLPLWRKVRFPCGDIPLPKSDFADFGGQLQPFLRFMKAPLRFPCRGDVLGQRNDPLNAAVIVAYRGRRLTNAHEFAILAHHAFFHAIPGALP